MDERQGCASGPVGLDSTDGEDASPVMRGGRRLLLAGAASLAAPALLASEAVAQAQRRPQAPARAQPRPEPAIPATPASTPLGPFDTIAKHALLLDFQTGAVLLEKAADERMPPASMSKLMTAYVVFALIKSGKLNPEQTMTVSEKAWRTQGSKMFVDIGTQVKVIDLIRGMIVQSGNDACVVLAEGIAGSEEAFAELATRTGREIGLKDSVFRNSHGLPDPGHRMTARDLSVLAIRLIHDFPDWYRIYSEKSFRYHGITQGNRNPLLYRDGGADGLKTGHIEESGYGLVASAVREGRRLILVVNGLPNMQARADEASRLMDWAFGSFTNVALFRAGETVADAAVWLGVQETVPLVPVTDVTVTVARAWRDRVRASVRYDQPVKAPVARGVALGQLVTGGEGIPSQSFALVTGQEVPRLSFVPRIGAVLKHYTIGS